ncbi:MAG: TetR/AcrR family transcriptional regulator [Hyphomonas sp.]
MAAQGKHREAILSAAVRLFRQQGYAATGLAEILEVSGAPRGSLYHYFPGGKVEIGEKAVARAGETVAATLSELAASSANAGDLITRYGELLGGWLKQSGFRDGSPLTTTILETVPEHEPIRRAALAAFDAWAVIITDAAQASGVPPERARALATVAIMLIEGGMIQCRVQRSVEPLKLAAAEAKRLLETAQS